MQQKEHPFLKTVEQHSALIAKICRSFCKDDEDAADLKQEILLNLWRGWKRWKPNHRPITWMWRVAMNTAISWRRARQRRVVLAPLESADMPDDTSNSEAIAHLYGLIAQLPPGDQRLLQFYIDGWSGAEIAQMMGITASNVTTRINRIKEKLRNIEDKESHEYRRTH